MIAEQHGFHALAYRAENPTIAPLVARARALAAQTTRIVAKVEQLQAPMTIGCQREGDKMKQAIHWIDFSLPSMMGAHGSQYLDIVGSTSSRQRTRPPARLHTRSIPAPRSRCVAAALRRPL